MRRYIFTFLLLLGSTLSLAQPRHSAGVTVSAMTELFPHAYYYRGIGGEAVYRYAFMQCSWCELQATAALHYTSTHFSAVAFPTDDYRTGFELGLTVGLLWNIAIFKDYLRGYLGGYIGPMYTPLMPARQGGNINFSDNLCFGFHVKLYRELYLDLRYTYRHLSNANFSSPNYGLNDHCAGIGLFYKF